MNDDYNIIFFVDDFKNVIISLAISFYFFPPLVSEGHDLHNPYSVFSKFCMKIYTHLYLITGNWSREGITDGVQRLEAIDGSGNMVVVADKPSCFRSTNKPAQPGMQHIQRHQPIRLLHQPQRHVLWPRNAVEQ